MNLQELITKVETDVLSVIAENWPDDVHCTVAMVDGRGLLSVNAKERYEGQGFADCMEVAATIGVCLHPIVDVTNIAYSTHGINIEFRPKPVEPATAVGPLRQALALDLADSPATKFYMGKLVVLDRGSAERDDGVKGHGILVGGLLLTEDGCPISGEVMEACTSELWEVEVLIRPRRRFRDLGSSGRGTLEKLLLRYLSFEDALPPAEVFNDERGTWEPNDREEEGE